MGCCGASIKTKKETKEKQKEEQKKEMKDLGPDPNFPDFEEWEGDKYSGVGAKRMKGYKCDLPIDQLNDKKRQFWDKKISENKDWEIVQKICIADDERIKLYLEENKFTLVNNCINHMIGPDGAHFHVPNYCINDPYFEKELVKNDEEEKKIILNLFVSNDKINLKEEFSNHDNGEKIKKVFSEKTNMNEDEYKLRIIFSGTEIKDNDLIYQHKLKNEDKIIIYKIKR